jgi:hypothetical protein
MAGKPNWIPNPFENDPPKEEAVPKQKAKRAPKKAAAAPEQPSEEAAPKPTKEAEDKLGGSLVLEQTGKSWVCRRQKLLLTYATHIPKEALMEFLAKKPPRPLEFFRASHETGEAWKQGNLKYDHTHVVVDWGFPYTWKDPRLLDWIYPDEGDWAGKDIGLPPSEGGRCCHPNVRYIRAGNDNWLRVCDYIAKEDLENQDLKMPEKGSWGVQLADLKMKPDLLSFASKHPETAFKNSSGISAMCDAMKKQVSEDEAAVLYPPNLRLLNWQRCSYDILKSGPPDGRHIWWIWGKDHKGAHGKEGKTVFACFLAVNMRALFLGNSSTQNIAYSYDETKHKIVVFDLTKSGEERVNYTAMEALKNGAIYSGKYHSSPKVGGTRPWVIVMSNHPPAKDAMADDRFIVHNLRLDPWFLLPEEDPKGVLVPFNECNRMGAFTESPLAKIMDWHYLTSTNYLGEH